MTYPHFEDLNTAPDFLYIGAVAIKQLRHYRWIDPPPTKREMTKAERRAYEAKHRKPWAARNNGRRIG